MKRKPGIVLGWGMVGVGISFLIFGLMLMGHGEAIVGIAIGGIGLFMWWLGASNAKNDTFRICPVCRCEVMEKDYCRRCSTCGAEVGKPYVPKQG